MRLLRAAVRNRIGLELLGLSCLFALSMATLPPLALWSSRALLAFGVGVAAYVLTLVVDLLPTTPTADMGYPATRQLLNIRRSMADRLAELQSADRGSRSPLVSVVAEAVRHMDSQLVPTFRSIVVRHQDLDRHLQQYESGKLTPPDPENLERLHRIYDHQQEAIDSCVRQAANAYATLIALVQAADEAGAAKQATMWATDLGDIYDGLSEVLSGVDPYERAMLQLRLDADKRGTVRPLIEEALERVEPLATTTVVAYQISPAVRREYPDGLTQREAEVLALLADGLISRQIADRLVVSVATVSRHIANIYVKIDARGRADATRYALKHSVTSKDLFHLGAGSTQPNHG
jgi:DNA-binding CsgD family transcriptional regulator